MFEAVQQAYIDSYEGVVAGLPGGSVPWVRRVRDSGLARFREVGFPTPRDEDWKYTSVRPIAKQPFAPALNGHNGIDPSQLEILKKNSLDSYRCVFVNGHFAPSLSDLDQLPSGVAVMSLSAALKHCPGELEAELGRYAPSSLHGFAALNTAFLTDGAYIRVGRNCTLERPIELIYVSTGDGEQPRVSYPRNLAIAENGSRAVILERYLSLEQGRYLTNSVTELVARSCAQVDYYKLQEESTKAFHVCGLFVHQGRDSTVTTNNIALGGAIARTDLHVTLHDVGAHSILNGLYIGMDRQHIDNHTQVDHRVARCTSDEFYKGVLAGRSRAVFHGRIVVHQDAQHTDAQQQNNNLLLSRDAEVDTKPQLEIYADDVKCSHGATVGQLDPTAIFYLRSRGIDEKTARGLLTHAFASDVINRFDVEPIRRELEHHLTHTVLHGKHVEAAT
jgi:Fe-S cluster assembly protein SufD